MFADMTSWCRNEIIERLSVAHIIVIGGGHAFHLLNAIERLDLRDELRVLAETRIIVGSSAGAMVLGPSPALASQSAVWCDLGQGEDPWQQGLGLVDFYVRPHLDLPDEPICSEQLIRAVAQTLPAATYAIDNDSGAVVVDGNATSVGDGRVIRIEPAHALG